MKKSGLLFLFLAVNYLVLAQNNSVNYVIESYEAYYELHRPPEIINAKVKFLCPPKRDDFYQYYNTKFIDFSSLRESSQVNAFSFSDSLCSPLLRKLIITSKYGMRNGKKHFGVDFRVNVGDTVRSVFCGKVRIAKWDKTYGYVVVIRNFNMSETVYAHLDKILVAVNQEIEMGYPIGLGGNTGRSSGPHLHFEIRYKGFPINPIIDGKFFKKIPTESSF